MKIKRIVPNIQTSQVAETRKFYGDFLALELTMDMDWIVTYASSANPTAQISVVRSDDNDSSTIVSLTIEVDEVDAAYRVAQKLGYEITYPITDEPWGVRRFHVRDPNGLIVNLMSHIDN